LLATLECGSGSVARCFPNVFRQHFLRSKTDTGDVVDSTRIRYGIRPRRRFLAQIAGTSRTLENVPAEYFFSPAEKGRTLLT
jgi:hypothetical protein